MNHLSLSEPRSSAREALEMRACVLREPGGPVATEPVLLEPPRRGEVLVRVAAAGVCHSDLHLADGRSEPGAGRSCSATRAPASSRRSAKT